LNLVDSSAWIAWFRDEKNAAEFAPAVEDLEHLVVPTIALIEVFRFIRRHADERSALEAVAHMNCGGVAPLDGDLAIAAAEVGLELRLPLADSIIYATARKYDAVVWTQDADFKDLPGVRYFPLQNQIARKGAPAAAP
jgi:predicted nucleic acid-binding protein